MRLGQLSRKLQVKTAEIIDLLQSEYDVAINNHPNSKVPEELVAHLEDRFKKEIVLESPAQLEASAIEDYEVIVEIPKTETPNDSEIQELKEEELEEVMIIENTPNNNDNDIVDEEAELNIVDGIIKAPKIEFAGVKVVGKIELPEKKVEVVDEIEEIETTEIPIENNELDISEQPQTESIEEVTETPVKEEKLQPSPKPAQRKTRPRRQEKILLTPEEERRIKLKEAQKKKLEAQKEKKQKRRETYSLELKPSKNNTSPQKQKKAKPKKAPKKKKPTSLWGRFIYWLND